MQAQNPLGYTCAPNGAGPDYITELNFPAIRRFRVDAMLVRLGR
jgi:hypothetical protein